MKRLFILSWRFKRSLAVDAWNLFAPVRVSRPAPIDHGIALRSPGPKDEEYGDRYDEKQECAHSSPDYDRNLFALAESTRRA